MTSRPVPVSSSIVKPTLETRYHIDYEWWNRAGRDLRIYLLSHLCAHHQEVFKEDFGDKLIDWIDPVTAEVSRVNGVQHALRVHCSQEQDYVSDKTSLVDAVFRVLLANGNAPMTVIELADETGRPPTTILRTLSGSRVYKGLRPTDAAPGGDDDSDDDGGD